MMVFRRRHSGLFALFLFILLLSPGCGGGGDSATPTPRATTVGASSITVDNAVLNGSVNPNGLATNAWFEWGTDPGLAAFTTTTSQPLGSGTGDNTVSQKITGLNFGTTYYFRVAGSNSAGITKGSIVSFATASPNDPPTVQTFSADNISVTAMTLHGSVGPNGLATDAWFEYGTDNTFTNPTLTHTTTHRAKGSGMTSVQIDEPITGLDVATTYYFRVVASNSAGTSRGPTGSQSTSALTPTVTTQAADNVTTSGANLKGLVNPNGLATDAWFEYGTDNTFTNPTLTHTTTHRAKGSGMASVQIDEPITGLDVATIYYFRVVASNSAGTRNGSIASFTTATPNVPPTVNTLGATGITASGATLNGNANPNGLATAAHFEWGQDPDLVGAATTADQAIGSGSADVSLSAPLDALIASTTYYYRVVATSAAGTSNGTILSFTSSNIPTPIEGIIFSKLFSTFGGTGVFSLDFYPTREYGSGGYICIRIMDTPTTYFEFSTVSASDPSKGSFIKVRKDVVVDSAPFPFPYSQDGTYPIRISMDQSLSTVEAFGRTASLTRDDNSNPLVYFEVWTSDQDAYYDNIKMEPGFFDDFSSDTTGTYNTFFISGTNSTFTYDAVGQRAWVRTGNGGP